MTLKVPGSDSNPVRQPLGLEITGGNAEQGINRKTRRRIHTLPARHGGTYYWRVRAVDAAVAKLDRQRLEDDIPTMTRETAYQPMTTHTGTTTTAAVMSSGGHTATVLHLPPAFRCGSITS